MATKEKGKKGKKQEDERERALMDYMKKHMFFEKFKDTIKEMLDMHPNLPKDPVKYIKTHIDYTNKEAREVERDLKTTRKAIAKFEEENAIFKYQLQLFEASGDGSGSWSTTSRGPDEKPKEEEPSPKKRDQKSKASKN